MNKSAILLHEIKIEYLKEADILSIVSAFEILTGINQEEK